MMNYFTSPTLAAALDFGRMGRLAEPEWIHALWAAPAVALLTVVVAAARRRALRRFADRALLPGLVSALSPLRRALKGWLLALATLALAAALTRPQINPDIREVERQGRDVVFLVDVSRSMLAQDLAPSRLERAKLWIKDLVDDLKGERVALVAFAGGASVRSPLTVDRDFFTLAVDELSPDSAPRGGTLIGDAIRKTLTDVMGLDLTEAPDPESPRLRTRDIVLITDGEDQESVPVAAAETAGRLGVRIIALGLGSESGSLVPTGTDANDFVEFNGELVRSRLDSATLESVARATPGGAYLNIGTGDIDLAQVYRDLIASAEQTAIGTAAVTEYDEAFWPFALAALILLALEAVLSERRRKP